MRSTWANRFLLLVIFLLPWQTRWIFAQAAIHGDVSEYGKLSLYATELLLLIVIILRGRLQLGFSFRWITQASYFFVASAFFSLAFTAFFQIGIIQVLHLLFAFSLFLTLCDTRTNFRKVVYAFLYGLIIPSVFAWIQVARGNSPEFSWLGLALQNANQLGTAVVETTSGRLLRAYGSFPHPNIFGGYIAIGLIFLFWLARAVISRAMIAVFIGMEIVLIVSIFLTFSRGAWLALLLGSITYFFYWKKNHAKPSSLQKILFVIGCLTVVVCTGFFWKQISVRFEPDTRLEQISLQERISQYKTFGSILRFNPLFGIGPGAYTFASASVFPGQDVWLYQPIHNTFLLLLSELGIVGLIAFIYLIIRIAQDEVRVTKSTQIPFGLIILLVLFVLGVFDHYLWSFWPGLALSSITLAFVVRLKST